LEFGFCRPSLHCSTISTSNHGCDCKIETLNIHYPTLN
jgi:hypothetical protein